jgi:anaerobic selenocysteine-containing dehydrogenase
MAFARKPDLLKKLKSSPAGIDLGRPEYFARKWETGKLRSDGKPGFPTPSGKVEIASTILAKHGYKALPEYNEPKEGPVSQPEMAKKFPLILNTGARLMSTFHSQHLNIPSLLRLQDKPRIIMNLADAEARGIRDGTKVNVVTSRGRVALWASVGGQIPPGEVEVNKGGGHAFQSANWRDANINNLTDNDNVDPISGFPVFKALLCEVEKV